MRRWFLAGTGLLVGGLIACVPETTGGGGTFGDRVRHDLDAATEDDAEVLDSATSDVHDAATKDVSSTDAVSE